MCVSVCLSEKLICQLVLVNVYLKALAVQVGSDAYINLKLARDKSINLPVMSHFFTQGFFWVLYLSYFESHYCIVHGFHTLFFAKPQFT